MKNFSFAILQDIHLGRKKSILNWWDRFLPRSSLEVIGEKIEERLRCFVEKVNNSPEIQFVISVGDMTESLTSCQVEKIKSILAGLKVPWLPLMGNHDIWSYERDSSGKVIWNAEKPLSFGDFKEFFHEEFENASQFFKNWEKQGGEFGNFTFIYNDIRFIIVDNVNRRKSPFGLPGTTWWSCLYPESKKWLKEQLSRTEKRKIVISHAPLKKGLLNSLSSGKTIVHITGHMHKENVREVKKITTFTTGALYLKPVLNVVKILSDEIKFHFERIP